MITIGDFPAFKMANGNNLQHQLNGGLYAELMKRVGGSEHLSGGVGKHIRPWLNGKDNYEFKNFDEFADTLNEAGVLWKNPSSGKGLGPSSIGPRPPFRGEAADMTAPNKHDRRHVISCSTLGKAVEKSPGSLEEINKFLGRHKCYDEFTDIKQARREAWKLVNSHIGNLWPGQRGDNRALGFIRAPLHEARGNVDDTGSLTQKQNKDLLDTLAKKPQGPLFADGKASWKEMGKVMSELIENQQSIRDGEEEFPDVTGADQPLTEDLHELEKNADLDIPAIDRDGNPIEMGGTDYFVQLTDIYADVRTVAESNPPDTRGTGNIIDNSASMILDDDDITMQEDNAEEAEMPNLFIENGTLDRYMALDLNNINKLKLAAVNNPPSLDENGKAPPLQVLGHLPPHPGHSPATGSSSSSLGSSPPGNNTNNSHMGSDGSDMELDAAPMLDTQSPPLDINTPVVGSLNSSLPTPSANPFGNAPPSSLSSGLPPFNPSKNPFTPSATISTRDAAGLGAPGKGLHRDTDTEIDPNSTRAKFKVGSKNPSAKRDLSQSTLEDTREDKRRANGTDTPQKIFRKK